MLVCLGMSTVEKQALVSEAVSLCKLVLVEPCFRIYCCCFAVAALSTQLSTAALDKHPQSKERGITLDLGFSSFTAAVPDRLKSLGCDELQFTLVDCPGHASLIRTIIGGAQIIDMMLLVIDITKGIQVRPCAANLHIIITLFLRRWMLLRCDSIPSIWNPYQDFLSCIDSACKHRHLSITQP